MIGQRGRQKLTTDRSYEGYSQPNQQASHEAIDLEYSDIGLVPQLQRRSLLSKKTTIALGILSVVLFATFTQLIPNQEVPEPQVIEVPKYIPAELPDEGAIFWEKIHTYELQTLLAVQIVMDLPNVTKIVGFLHFGPEEKNLFENIEINKKKQTNFQVLSEDQLQLPQKSVSFVSGNQTLNGDVLILVNILEYCSDHQLEILFKQLVNQFKYVVITNDHTAEENSSPKEMVLDGQRRPIDMEKRLPFKKELLIEEVVKQKVKRTYIIPQMPML